MADYAITGKKGNGKTLFAVGLVRDALRQGKRVATNLDIYPEAFGRPHCKSTYLRLPDRPTVEDFEAIGRGQDGVIEDDNGIIILDETSTFFNTRSWGDKARQPMLDWLVHSRKYGWDVYYIMQGLAQVDKQIRDTQAEYHIAVKRTDKWPIPFITPLSAALGYEIKWPKFHFGVIRQGMAADSLFIGRKWYRGRDLYAAYETQQIYLDRDHPMACGLHTRLSAYHVKGRHMSWWERTKPAIAGAFIAGAALGVMAGVGGYYGITHKATKADQATYNTKTPPVAFVSQDGKRHMLMGDGRMLLIESSKLIDGAPFHLAGGVWYGEKTK